MPAFELEKYGFFKIQLSENLGYEETEFLDTENQD